MKYFPVKTDSGLWVVGYGANSDTLQDYGKFKNVDNVLNICRKLNNKQNNDHPNSSDFNLYNNCK